MEIDEPLYDDVPVVREPRQLQFSFMRDVNLQCYIQKQLSEFEKLYTAILPSDKQKTISYREFVSTICTTQIPELFRGIHYKTYFSDLEDIVEQP